MRIVCLISFVAVVASPCCGKLPPDPDNAALLYYQAFLLCPEADSATRRLLERVSYGSEPNEQVRQYVGMCRDAIEYAEQASTIRDCDWGIWYSLGLGHGSRSLQAVRRLSHVLHTDARILADKGDYHGALERGVTMRRLANHVGDHTFIFYAIAVATEHEAERCICQVLGSMPVETETVTWLKSHLAAVPAPSLSLAKALRVDLELTLHTMRTHEGTMTEIRRRLSEVLDNQEAQRARELSDEELLAYIRKPFTEFLDSAVRIANSDMLYEDGCAAIQKLIRDLRERVGSDPVGKVVGEYVITGMAEMVPRFYTIHMLSVTRLNAFSIALDLYLEKAKTGRLPETLPAGLPKDVYSGQDFIYTITEDGFVLRSRVKRADMNKPIELECRI